MALLAAAILRQRCCCRMNRPGWRQNATTNGPGVILLGQVAARFPAIDVECNRCDWRERLHTAPLVVEQGADIAASLLLRTIAADCPRMQSAALRDVCVRGSHAAVGAGEVMRGRLVTASAYPTSRTSDLEYFVVSPHPGHVASNGSGS